MIAPHDAAGWVLDFLESAARTLAVGEDARTEPELARRIDLAKVQLDKASVHALIDPAYAAWMGGDAWSSFTALLDSADGALRRARRSRERRELWTCFCDAVEQVTAALAFARVLWRNLPPEAAELDEPEVEAEA